MKTLLIKLLVGFALVLQFTGCADHFSSVFILEIPKTPENWVSILGQPHWKVEWFDKNGEIQSKVVFPGHNTEAELPVTWVNPVTAWPFWPEHSLIPGNFKPAGALFPFDCSDGRMILSWEAGVDAFFYKELAFANSLNEKKIPSNYDWLRFRELFKTNVLDSAAVKDPWLIDWHYVAGKTIESNFDRRRLIPQAVTHLNIPAPSGTWYDSSPFSDPLYFPQEETPAFPLNTGSSVWVSSEGILRTNGKTWVFTMWKNKESTTSP
ncbi:MAG: hypothetical protein FWC19_08525 [Treponema sp.]|nr:hypothetical protein [Treponema sp.]MCL2272825.1 hypothetical protein [Treponema sp.]